MMTINGNPGETDSRKAICCLMVLEIADYEAKPVFDQIRLTQHLRQVLSDTIANAGDDGVVSIVREQGAVLSFLADPEECFTTALAVREAILNQNCYHDLLLRIGINLGSVEIARDEFGQAYVSGAGRRDAERVMHQGPPRQISVTRPFFEVLSRAAPELAGTLEYQGVFTDTLGPSLGLYRLSVTRSSGSPSPSTARRRITDSPAQSARLLRHANPTGSVQAVHPAITERRRGRRLQVRYLMVALLLGAAVLTLSSRFRADVAALTPAPQLAAAVGETAMPRAELRDPDVYAAVPATTATMRETLGTTSESAAEKPARRGSASAPRVQGAGPVADRVTRLQAKQEQEKKADLATATSPPPDSATLVLTVRPWGEVYVDGKKVGITPPLKRLQVTPGQRLITIKNSFLPEYRIRLNVDPNAELTVAHDFSCTSERGRRCWEEVSKGLAQQSPFRFKTVGADPQTEVR